MPTPKVARIRFYRDFALKHAELIRRAFAKGRLASVDVLCKPEDFRIAREVYESAFMHIPSLRSAITYPHLSKVCIRVCP